MNVAAVQHLPIVNHINHLTPVERYRLGQFTQGVEETINARNDLEPSQKEAILQELTRRITQVALERHFYRESPNIALRGINLQTTPPETLCQTFIKGGVIGLGMIVVSTIPIIGGTALVVSYVAAQVSDNDGCLSKFFQWLGCIKKPEPAEEPLFLLPINHNQPQGNP